MLEKKDLDPSSKLIPVVDRSTTLLIKIHEKSVSNQQHTRQEDLSIRQR